VTLYQGGQYWLYKYKRYDDVRLVLAPERAIASFGGDPTTSSSRAWSLDFTMLRAYENGKPVKIAEPLKFNWAGAAEGDSVFVSGHPGGTDRLLTTSQLKFPARCVPAAVAAALLRAARPPDPVRQAEPGSAAPLAG